MNTETLEYSSFRRRKNHERRELLARGKTSKLGSALVKATNRAVDMDSESKTYGEACNPTHWVPCNLGTSIRRLMRAGRQMCQLAREE